MRPISVAGITSLLTLSSKSHALSSQLWIVMEYLEAGSLLDLMNEIPSTLDEPTIAYVMKELLIVSAFLSFLTLLISS
jgi:serine/threonine protein kinase